MEKGIDIDTNEKRETEKRTFFAQIGEFYTGWAFGGKRKHMCRLCVCVSVV